jgi:hypothetical protein
MGYTGYSADVHNARAASRAATGTPTFAHDADVKSGKAASTLHPQLDIKGKVRESRDSDAHPCSKAIAVIFDNTGSMGTVPRVLQQKLPRLMSLLLLKGYCRDPQVLFGCVGDYHTDGEAVLQLGQFESGNEMDDAFAAMALLGRGGGTFEESYELAAWYLANRVEMDCLQKRGEKGYLFIVGDEKPYPRVSAQQVEQICGVRLQADVTTEALFAALQRKFEVFFVVPGGTSYFGSDELYQRWAGLVGAQRVLKVEDPAAVCEVIAATVGQMEAAVDHADVVAHLIESGADARTARLAASATANVKPGAIARVDGGLPARAGRAAGRL